MNVWQDPLSPWKTKAAYFSWLRGMLRRAWMRNPISIKFKNALCRPAKPHDNVSHRVKSVGSCSRCGGVFAKSKLEVDHVEPAGSLQDWDDVGPFVQRLLGCSSENLRLVCKECHGIITAAERFKCSEDDAAIRKRLIQFGKTKANEQMLLLTKLGLPTGRNAMERGAIYKTHIMQE